MSNGEITTTDIDKVQIIEEGPTLPALLTEDFVKQFEKGVDIYKRWVSVCYRLTRESHWVNHGKDPAKPKFSLQGPGAEALMNPLGVSYEKPHIHREDKQDEKGDFYIYWCEGYAESRTLGRRGYYVGYCDSRDQFFTSRPGWSPKTGEGDVKKSSITNWTVNLVSRLAGIRDPSPESLLAAGLKLELIPSIEYKRADQSQQRTLEGGEDIISEAQGKRFYAIAKGQNLSDEAIHLYLWEKHQLKSSKDIKKRDYEKIVAWAQAGGQEGPK
jgi:hypothetical protein